MKTSSLLTALVFGVIAGGAQAADITLKASHDANAGEPYHLGLQRMGELLLDYSGGQATIEVYPNAQLGNETESVQGVQLGTIDLAVTSEQVFTNFVPEIKPIGLPFMFDDQGHLDRATSDPEFLERLNELYARHNFRLIGMFTAGPRSLITKTPIEGIDDVRGLKFRTIPGEVHMAAYTAVGANPVSIAYSELYGALQTGVVDGADGAPTQYHSKRFYEVAPHYALMGWLQNVATVVTSEDRFQRLPADVQEALLKAGREASAYQRATQRESDDERFDLLLEEGVEVTTLDPEPFKQALKPVYDQFIVTDEDKALAAAIKAYSEK